MFKLFHFLANALFLSGTSLPAHPKGNFWNAIYIIDFVRQTCLVNKAWWCYTFYYSAIGPSKHWPVFREMWGHDSNFITKTLQSLMECKGSSSTSGSAGKQIFLHTVIIVNNFLFDKLLMSMLFFSFPVYLYLWP